MRKVRGLVPLVGGKMCFFSKSVVLFLAVILTLAFSSLVVQPANADELYGRVRGTVSDASGAVLPGVQLKLTNIGTGKTED